MVFGQAQMNIKSPYLKEFECGLHRITRQGFGLLNSFNKILYNTFDTHKQLYKAEIREFKFILHA
jgi:hypothetical protein